MAAQQQPLEPVMATTNQVSWWMVTLTMGRSSGTGKRCHQGQLGKKAAQFQLPLMPQQQAGSAVQSSLVSYQWMGPQVQTVLLYPLIQCWRLKSPASMLQQRDRKDGGNLPVRRGEPPTLQMFQCRFYIRAWLLTPACNTSVWAVLFVLTKWKCVYLGRKEPKKRWSHCVLWTQLFWGEHIEYCIKGFNMCPSL